MGRGRKIQKGLTRGSTGPAKRPGTRGFRRAIAERIMRKVLEEMAVNPRRGGG